MRERLSDRVDDVIAWLRGYARNRINSRLIDERRCLPPHVVLDLGNAGLFGLQVPLESGGLALDCRSLMRLLEQLAAVDYTVATFVTSHMNGLRAVQAYARPDVRDRLLPALASGRQIAAYAITEPGAGSNPRALSARAVPISGNRWQLYGTKSLVDHGSWASVVTLFAQLTDHGGRPRGITGFVIPQGAPGLRVGLETLTMGVRGQVQTDLHLEGVRVSPDEMLGEPGSGMDIIHDTLTAARLGMGAKCVGVMKRCVQQMHRYASRRTISTGLLLDNSVILARLSETIASIRAVEALVSVISTSIDRGRTVPTEAYLACKNAGSEYLCSTADLLIRTLGGRGYMEVNLAPQILRDSRTTRISEGPNETLNMYLGSSVIHSGHELSRFLSHDLKSPGLAEVLTETAAAIRARCSGPGAPFSDPEAADSWIYALVGEVATSVILRAALATRSGPSYAKAGEWARRSFERIRDRALEAPPAEACLCDSGEMTDLVSSFAETIGDLEQFLPGESQTLDELLRIDPSVSVPAPEDLPASIGEPVSPRNDSAIRPRTQLEIDGDWPPLLLSTDRPRRPHHRPDPRSVRLSLREETAERLRGFSRDGKTSIRDVLLGVYCTLLHRYSGNRAFSITAQDVRPGLSTEGGDSPGSALVRCDFRDNPSLETLLHDGLRTRENPGIESRLSFEWCQTGSSRGTDSISEACVSDAWSGSSEPLAELILEWSDRRDILEGTLSYDAELFSEPTILRMTGHMMGLLEEALLAPTRPLSELPMLTVAEKEELLLVDEDPEVDPRSDRCVHLLFEAQVRERPDAIAVVWEDREVSYAHLNRRSNQLAALLREHGAGPGQLVGIATERSIEMMVGLLGILKAGAGYVPLDPNYPEERLDFMIRDSGLSILLTQSRFLERFHAKPSVVLCLDVAESLDSRGSDPLENSVLSEHNAYTIYTSGSTGKPKGIEVPHRAVVNFLGSMVREPGFDSEDVLLAVTTISFDISNLELFAPLVVGARLVLASHEVAHDPERLREKLSRHAVTVMQATPTTWKLLFAGGWSGDRSLRCLCGGEAFPRELAEKLYGCCRIVWNLYGPTETTIWSSIHRVDGCPGIVPIGRPIARTRTYVLDSMLQPVPKGVPGELYIGGAGLAQGYRGRPDLTAERFVPDPVGGGGRRLYRTGDCVRFSPEVRLEFLERLDHQIKVRGHRIELGEIEATLEEHPAVREAAARVHDEASGETRVVGYIVADPGATGAWEGDPELQAEHVSQWESLWRETYGNPRKGDPSFNIVGWNSSYTGEPIRAEEMRQWVDRTVERVAALEPRRVLEIGCGTGLLLCQIAPQCELYLGTDFSERCLMQVRDVVAQRKLQSVRVEHRTADDFDGLESEGPFDTILLNSVIQYFPSLDYLESVLEGAVGLLAPGGSIFVGDVRDLRLLEAFHVSVELDRASDSLSTSELKERVDRAVANEKELLVDREFFEVVVQERFSEVLDVEVQLKRGDYHNELTRFRYDVVVRTAERTPPRDVVEERLDGSLPIAEIRRRVLESAASGIWVRDVLNQRTFAPVKALERLESAAPQETCRELRTISDEAALDPEDFWTWAEETRFSVEVGWAGSGALDRFDVWFRDREGAAPRESGPERRGAEHKPRPRRYANHPLVGTGRRKLVPSIRRFLQGKLPEYMVPSTLVLLESLPKTSNGKIDRGALHPPEPARPALEEVFVAPRTEVEKTLAEIWSELLGVDRVGVHDNFFELGAHSIVGTQVVSRIRDVLQVQISLSDVFRLPTLSELALAVVERQTESLDDVDAVALLDELEEMSDDDVQRLLLKDEGEVKVTDTESMQ